jgi:hypothetical protein
VCIVFGWVSARQGGGKEKREATRWQARVAESGEHREGARPAATRAAMEGARESTPQPFTGALSKPPLQPPGRPS